MAKELEIGKRYTWEEVVAAYPGKWVRMNDCTLGWGDSVIDGILTAIHEDGDTAKEWSDVYNGINNKENNDKFQRTTSSLDSGIMFDIGSLLEEINSES